MPARLGGAGRTRRDRRSRTSRWAGDSRTARRHQKATWKACSAPWGSSRATTTASSAPPRAPPRGTTMLSCVAASANWLRSTAAYRAAISGVKRERDRERERGAAPVAGSVDTVPSAICVSPCTAARSPVPSSTTPFRSSGWMMSGAPRGTSRSPSSKPPSPIGTLITNNQRHDATSSTSAPTTGPSAGARLTAMPSTPMTCPSRSGLAARPTSLWPAGTSSPAARPWTTRSPSSQWAFGASAHSAEVAANVANAASHRRPTPTRRPS